MLMEVFQGQDLEDLGLSEEELEGRLARMDALLGAARQQCKAFGV